MEKNLYDKIKSCDRLEITLRVNKKWNVFAKKDDRCFRSHDVKPDGYETQLDALYDIINWLLK